MVRKFEKRKKLCNFINQEPMVNLNSLPLHLLSHIQTFLDNKNISHSCLVSKNIKTAAEAEQVYKARSQSIFPTFKSLNGSWKERFKICRNWETGACTQRKLDSTIEGDFIFLDGQYSTIKFNDPIRITNLVTQETVEVETSLGRSFHGYQISSSYFTWVNEDGIKVINRKNGELLRTIVPKSIPPAYMVYFTQAIHKDKYLVWVYKEGQRQREDYVYIWNLENGEAWSFSVEYNMECHALEDGRLILKGDAISIVDPETKIRSTLLKETHFHLATDGNKLFALEHGNSSKMLIWDDLSKEPRKIEIEKVIIEKYSPFSIYVRGNFLFIIDHRHSYTVHFEGGAIQVVNISTGKLLYVKCYQETIKKVDFDDDKLLAYFKEGGILQLDYSLSPVEYPTETVKTLEVHEIPFEKRPHMQPTSEKKEFILKRIVKRIYHFAKSIFLAIGAFFYFVIHSVMRFPVRAIKMVKKLY